MIEFCHFQRLKQWFSNRAAAANSGPQRDDLAWTPLLQQLHQSRNTRPRQRTAVQQFMRDYADEVKAAFTAKYGDGKNLSNAQRMNNQHAIAKSLLYEKYSHLVSELEEKAKAQNVTGVKEWNMILEDISLAENVAQYVYSLLYSCPSDSVSFVGLRKPSSTPYSPFFTRLARMPVATLVSSLGIRRVLPMKDFLLRKSASSLLDPLCC